MASSNRHWPSMFKSKPCNAHHHHPWQHEMNPSSLISSSTICHRSPYTSSPSSSSGCEERSPEPKPRWNPKPEQIRILEAIFNSGMVNPPRDEIRKIRAQLQEYGQVGDANVFYWFQNRKSRSKHKLRNLQNSNKTNNNINHITRHQSSTPPPPQISPSNSSSSDNNNKSSPNSSSSKEIITIGPPSSSSFYINGFSSDVILPSSPCTGGSVSNHHPTTYFQTHHNNNNNEISLSEPFFFPASSSSSSATTHHQGFCFSEFSGIVQPHQHQNFGPCTSLLLTEMMNQKNKEHDHDHKGMKNTTMMNHHHLSFCVATSSSSSCVTPTIHSTVVMPSMAPANTTTTTTVTVPSLLVPQIQGEQTGGTAAKSIVYINDVAFEVAVGPFNVRAAFGEDAVLVHAATGQPVLTNEWGVTLQSLQPGAFYFLI